MQVSNQRVTYSCEEEDVQKVLVSLGLDVAQLLLFLQCFFSLSYDFSFRRQKDGWWFPDSSFALWSEADIKLRSADGCWCRLTCMTVSHLAHLPVPEAVRAEVENEVVVVRKCPKAQVDQITELVHGFDVHICSAETRTEIPTLNFFLFPFWQKK